MLALADRGSKLAEMIALHAKGLSQRDVAEALGMSQRWVCCALKALRLPPNGYGTKASRRKRSRAAREVARLRRFREASSLIAPEAWWEAEWPIVAGGEIAPREGFALFSALSRSAGMGLHGDGALQLLPAGRRVLARAPRDRLRALVALFPAGTTFGFGRESFVLGDPGMRQCRPASSLSSWCVTAKRRTEAATLGAFVRDELGQLGMGGRVRLDVGPRRVVKVKGVLIVGYEVFLSRLDARESLVVQASGIGGRRRFGCGVFVPCP